jgi:hypothetical protein
MDATEEGKQSVLVLVQLEAAGSVWHMQMEKFRYWKSTKQHHESWRRTDSWNHVVVLS